MPSDRIPKPSRHKATGQAVVRLNGKDHYLGKFGSKEAKAKYEELIARWLAYGRTLPETQVGLSVNDVVLAYDKHAEAYYKAAGSTTSETRCIKLALKPLRKLFGRTPVADFGPRKLKAVQQKMLETGWCRGYINHQINRIKRMFKWATSEELVPASVYHAIQSVAGFRKGMATVREAEPVKPVPQPFIDATLPFMPPPVCAMVELQLLTGMRPGETCIMRAIDIDMSGRVWTYRPQTHKTAHRGHERTIYIGPQAQDIIKPWLRTDLEGYLFSPAAAEEARNAERRQNRKTPMTPSQARRKRKRNRARSWGERYTTASYSRAVARACEKADAAAHEADPSIPADQVVIPAWTPNRLRHNAATNLRKSFGVELARIVLGHATAFTTEIYAEADQQQAMEVIAKIG